MASWIIRQIRLHPVRSSFLSIVAGAIGFYWVAPLVAINCVVPAVGLCMLGGLLAGGVVNWFTNRERQAVREPNLLEQRKEWIIHKLRSSRLNRAVQNTLIGKLERELVGERSVNEEWFHNWVQHNLNQDLTHTILHDWLQLTDKDAFQVFKRHLTRQPPESKRSVAHCFKLLNNDFNPMVGIVESFLTPTISEESFRREMNQSSGGLYDNFVRIAREGKLSYVKHALPKIAPSQVQKMLPEAIQDAAENGYLEMVKYLVGLLQKGKKEVTQSLFKIALKENHTQMFMWLLKTYEDEQLKSKEHEGLNIYTQIRFFNSQHNKDACPSTHPLVKIYNAIRKVNVLDFPSREGELKESALRR